MRKLFKSVLSLMMIAGVCAGFAACGDDKDDGGTPENPKQQSFPSEYRSTLSNYITIYDGANPPKLEGTFVMSPDELVYTSDGAKDPGAILSDYYVKFSNHDIANNTITYQGMSKGGTADAGIGGMISGSGNNFTVFFYSTTNYRGASDKRLTAFSGTLTSNGIKDLRWAWIVTEKSDDPDHLLPAEGVYRIFKDGDGLAESAVWPN